ncbi:microtubule-associated serine/threonine-protein kinase 3-like [Dendrobates tinctorius]|uniref:microtubule-associated serine/threonine-protein kinase 3-like n=1 Tax=Dendrobates tinctorius TaxID=92724 RepID=UPI003CC96621
MYEFLTDDITLKFQKCALHPKAQSIITQLLIKDPTHRLRTGGANEIKSHPFLSELDFENLQNMPTLRPDITSEEDTRYFPTGIERPKYMDSDEEVSDWPESLNYVSSSLRLSKIYIGMTTREFRIRVCEHVRDIEKAKEAKDENQLKTLPRHFRAFHNSEVKGLKMFAIDQVSLEFSDS